LDLARWLCPSSGECRTEVDGTVLRVDGLHFFTDGAVHVARWMTPRILAAADG